MLAISSVILLVWPLLRFWPAGAAVPGLAEGQSDGQPSVSQTGRSAPAQISLGVKLAPGSCWQTAGEPTPTAWTEVSTEVWAEVETEVETEVGTSGVEGEVRGREVWG